MSEEYVLAMDIGTTGARSVAFARDGSMLATSYREYSSDYPAEGWVEQDPEMWWLSSVETAREVVSRIKGQPAGIAVTNQRETVVPVDNEGGPLMKAIVWQDRRAAREVRELASRMENLSDITGLEPDPYFSLPKIMWIQRNRPEVFSKAKKFLLVHDYIVHKLTGEFRTDISNASRTMLLDLRKRAWSEEVAEAAGVDIDLMPGLAQSGEKVGELTPNAASAMGLEGGIPVFAGGGDQQCAALGLGVTAPGKAKVTTGTGSFILAPTHDSQKPEGLLVSAHVLRDVNVYEASIFTTGASYRWVRDNVFRQDNYEEMNSTAEEAGPGAGGVFFFPHLSGAAAPHWVSEARGAFHGLSLATTPGDMARAVIEGVSYEIRTCLEMMDPHGQMSSVAVDGGASKANIWNRVMADILGIELRKGRYEEATAFGAGIIAMHGLGWLSMSELPNGFTDGNEVFKPDTEAKKRYDTLYSRYRDLNRRLLETYS